MPYSELLTLLFTHAIGIIAGYFIGRYFKKKNDVAWQEKYEATQAELAELNKVYKKEKKQINRLEQERDSWKHKYKTLTVEHDTLNENLATANATIAEKQHTCDELTTELERLRNRHENLEKEHERLKERYATDMHDSKNWKSKRTTLEREVETYKGKWMRSEKEKARVEARLSDYLKQINDYEALKKTHRNLTLEHKKAQSDLKYWENQHYDAHQELKVAMETIEIQRTENLEFKQLLQGAEIKEQNLLKQIGNFKTKFVDVHNKYQALVKN